MTPGERSFRDGYERLCRQTGMRFRDPSGEPLVVAPLPQGEAAAEAAMIVTVAPDPPSPKGPDLSAEMDAPSAPAVEAPE